MLVTVNTFGNVCNRHTMEVYRHCSNNAEIAAEISRRGYCLYDDLRADKALRENLRARLGLRTEAEAETLAVALMEGTL